MHENAAVGRYLGNAVDPSDCKDALGEVVDGVHSTGDYGSLF
jgi:hypothetical protein